MGLSRRLELHDILKSIDGVADAYYQPPSNIEMAYPAIVYQLNDENLQHADNVPYRRRKRYSVTVIDRDPDSEIPDVIGSMPLCRFNRFFTKDNLNHFVYNLFY